MIFAQTPHKTFVTSDPQRVFLDEVIRLKRIFQTCGALLHTGLVRARGLAKLCPRMQLPKFGTVRVFDQVVVAATDLKPSDAGAKVGKTYTHRAVA